MIVHYLIGVTSSCGKGEMASSDRAAVTCRRCIARMEAGAERPLRPYLPSGRVTKTNRRKAHSLASEPKQTMDVAGMKVVLDASPYPLKKVDYPG